MKPLLLTGDARFARIVEHALLVRSAGVIWGGTYRSTGFSAGAAFLFAFGAEDVIPFAFVVGLRFLDSTVRAKRDGEGGGGR